MLTDASGRELRIGPLLGRGGEGAVHRVVGQSNIVAKLYTIEVASERIRKLTAMMAITTPGLLDVTAWPTGPVLHGGRLAGFLMPRIEGAEEAHVLYGPKSRKQKFPDAGFAFLVHAAANAARAFAVVHGHGLVVGDVNDRVAMIARNAIVRLIDCDSFQIVAGNERFPCEVGVPTFTPPELQHLSSFRGVARDTNHDAFGLAVLLFHLLFLGRHPYAGRFRGDADMPIEAAIREHRFAYAADAARTRMDAPPGTPAPGIMSAAVAGLFERAFSPGAAAGKERRPSAGEWVEALSGLQAQLRNCRENTAHAYLGVLETCPWCDLDARSGIELFNYVGPADAGPPIDVDAIWQAITGMIPLSLPPLPGVRRSTPAAPSPDAEILAGARRQEARVAAARQARALEEEKGRKAEAAVESAARREADARAFAARFEDDRLKLPALERRLRLARAERKRQWVWRGLSMAFVAITAYFAVFEQLLLAAGAAGGVLAVDFIAWLCRRGVRPIPEIAGEVLALAGSIALGPGHRETALVAATNAHAAARRKLIEAQGAVYRAMTAEQDAMTARTASAAVIMGARERLDAGAAAAAARHARATADYGALARDVEGLRAFLDQRIAELRPACDHLRQLARQRRSELSQIREELRREQLEGFLDGFFIAQADIQGITRNLKSTLASFGIETAADVEETRVKAVPGFGPVRTGRMLEWRGSLEADFRYVPDPGGDGPRKQAIERRIATERRRSERILTLGKSEFEQRIRGLAERIAAVRRDADAAAVELAHALRDQAHAGEGA